MIQKVMATPAARREADARRVDISKIPGTGVGGYVQLSDVLGYRGRRVTPLAGEYAAFYGVALPDIPGDGVIRKADVLAYKEARQPETIPVAGMRAVIARRMQESMQTAPQYTTHASVCAYELKKYLAVYTERCLAVIGVKPTLSDLLIRAVAVALREHRILNSSFGGTHIILHSEINIGLAVALDDGLIVPNIKNCGQKTLEEITAERKRLVDKARAGRLLPEEYTGGTFTISNMGQFPVEYFTPIINLPESAILGVGTITDKVVPVDGNIGIRPMMGLSLTSDHRHIDGAASGAFLKRLKEIIENPESMETEA